MVPKANQTFKLILVLLFKEHCVQRDESHVACVEPFRVVRGHRGVFCHPVGANGASPGVTLPL